MGKLCVCPFFTKLIYLKDVDSLLVENTVFKFQFSSSSGKTPGKIYLSLRSQIYLIL